MGLILCCEPRSWWGALAVGGLAENSVLTLDSCGTCRSTYRYLVPGTQYLCRVVGTVL